MLSTLLFSFALAHAAEPVSTVTIPVTEYLELKRVNEKSWLTSLEEARVSGDWGKRLQITFVGAMTGKPEAIPVLETVPGMSLSGCSGAGLLKVADNSIQLLPTAPRFKLTCDLDVKGNEGGFTLTVLNALVVKADVRGAEGMPVGEDVNRRQIRFERTEPTRAVASDPVNDKPSFQARYQISVTPEETKFQYTILAHNPARTPKAFELKFPNKEVVGAVVTGNAYENADGGLRLKLLPGDSQIRVSGRLPEPAFVSPLGGQGLEHLLIDNHPLLSLDVTGGARRVSPKDAGMRASFASARAYMLGPNDKFAWEKKTLSSFAALSYAVTSAAYTYYASTQSSALVEADFRIDNQGTPEIPVKVPGRATYLEVNGVPQTLTKDADDNLLLRLPSGGGQNVIVQYQAEGAATRAIASVSETLARPPALMSNVSVALQVPRSRGHVFASSLDDVYSRLNRGEVIASLVVFVAFFALLGAMGWTRGARWVCALAIGSFTLMVPDFVVGTLVAALAMWGVHHRRRVRLPTTWRGWIAAGVVALFAGVFLVPNLQRFGEFEGAIGSFEPARPMPKKAMRARGEALGSGGGGADYGAAADLELAEEKAIPPPPAMMAAAPAADEPASDYQGLPARITMPGDGYTLNFNAGMLDADGAVRLRFVTVADWVPRTFTLLLVVLVGWVGWRERRRLREYLVGR